MLLPRLKKQCILTNVPANALNKYITVQAERFRNPVLRIFHTELEAVYEEKNRSLDSDNSEVFETLFASLFKKAQLRFANYYWYSRTPQKPFA